MASISDDPDWRPWGTWQCDGFEQWEDEWHNVRKRFPSTTRGEVIEGALRDWSELKTYEMPRLALPTWYEEPARKFNSHTDKYRLGYLPGFPFAIMRCMRGVEAFLADVLSYPGEVTYLQRMVIDLLEDCIDQWADAGCDGLLFAEDWGTQEKLLVSPRLWHGVFEFEYVELIQHAENRGVDLWMHSCGYIKDIIPTLVDMGIRVLQLDQPKLSGLAFLAEVCHGKTAVWSPVDIQQDLPTGDEAHIKACARELIDRLGGDDGGFICGYYASPMSIGIDPKWQDWAIDEFLDYNHTRHGGPAL